MARLKVYITKSGFYELAVAAASQAKALAAWGIHQNLFAEGMAAVATGGAASDAALVRPGVVVRRPIGSKAPFSEDPELPRVKGGKPKANAAGKKKAAARRKAAAQRARLKAEEVAHVEQVAALKRARDALDAKLATAESSWSKRKRVLKTAGR